MRARICSAGPLDRIAGHIAPFLTSQAMRHRWSMAAGLAENSWGTGALANPKRSA